MCGIAGVHAPGPADPTAIRRGVERMVDRLAHRGPDGRGLLVASDAEAGSGIPTVVLGHTRLAIIDLTESAAQPMTAASAVSISFNGEIYNYRELRDTLRKAGATFTTASDTEVILRSYERWGDDFLERLDGMFAFAIWDHRRQRLLLARDRLGIKPLYVAGDRARTCFASEIRALLASGFVPARLDADALEDYLAYQTTPTPRTLVRNVTMLPAGTMMTVDAAGRRQVRTYWDPLAMPTLVGRDEANAPADVRALLDGSIRRHLVSDVPVGVFLSGGIDSAAIAALVRSAGVRPRTFTVSVPGSPFDEGPAARLIADALGTDHTEVALASSDVRGGVLDSLGAFDHPSGDAVNTFIISRAVRAAGVKVALSGVGGDELFAGYPSFGRLARFARHAPHLGRIPRPIRAAVGRAVELVGRSSVAASKVSDLARSDVSLAEAYLVQRQVFGAADRRRLLPHGSRPAEADGYDSDLRRAEARLADRGVTAFVSYAEAHTYMHDVLLRDTDQMSMRHGLEVRVPLLDHRLAAHLLRLPESARRPQTGAKPLLVAALGVDLPRAACGPKRGFVLPFSEWMRGPLREVCEHHLGPSGLQRRCGFDGVAIGRLWRDFVSGSRRTSWSRPWTLIALHAWLEATGVDL